MSNLGPLGFVRARQTRRLTDYQASLSGEVIAPPRSQARRLPIYQANVSRAILGWPCQGLRRVTDYQAWQPVPWLMREMGRRTFRQVITITQPEAFCLRPLVLDGRRGRIYWREGLNGPYKTAGIPQSARDPEGWRWYGPGIEQLRFSVSAGTNSLSLTVKHSSDQQPRPTIRLLPSAALGIEGVVIESPAGTGIFHVRAFTFTAAAAGVAVLQLEWLNFEEDATCVWGGLSVSN